MPPDDEVVEYNTMVWTLLCAFRGGGGGGGGRKFDVGPPHQWPESC